MVWLLFDICGIQNNQVDGRNVTAEDKSFQSLLSESVYLQTIIIHLLSKLLHASIGTTFFLGKDKIYFYVFFVILWEVFSFQGRQGRPKKTTKRRGISFLLTDLASLGSFLQ